MVCAAEGHHAEAHRLFDRAIAVSRANNDRWSLCESLLDKARLCAETESPSEAEPLVREALAVAGDAKNLEIEFKARLLLAELEVGLGLKDREDAIRGLEVLVAECSEDWQRAAVHYTIWLLEPDRRRSIRVAASLYKRLYTSAPDAEYSRRYERLTGKRLPRPATLSRIRETVQIESVDLESLIKEAELVTSARDEGVA
jgi:hypothetical protein